MEIVYHGGNVIGTHEPYNCMCIFHTNRKSRDCLRCAEGRQIVAGRRRTPSGRSPYTAKLQFSAPSPRQLPTAVLGESALPREYHIRGEKASNHWLFRGAFSKRSVEIRPTDGCTDKKTAPSGGGSLIGRLFGGEIHAAAEDGVWRHLPGQAQGKAHLGRAGLGEGIAL